MATNLAPPSIAAAAAAAATTIPNLANIVPIPILRHDLRLALATLYSLPSLSSLVITGGVSVPIPLPSSAQAHDYLLQFQSRNGRRKQNSAHNNNTHAEYTKNDIVGSSWLACLDLLLLSSIPAVPDEASSVPVQYAEALFAAQTLLHRVRRVKLSEAIDVELEPTIINNTATSNSGGTPSPELIFHGYKQWILHYLNTSTCTNNGGTPMSSSSFGIVSQLVHDYHPAVANNSNENTTQQQQQQQGTAVECEERIKGEISIMVLTSILDALIRRSCRMDDDDNFSQIRPLIKTIASSVAVIYARIRYTSSSVQQQMSGGSGPAYQTQPIVTSILSMVQSFQQQQQQPSIDATMASHITCLILLTALPEAIFTGTTTGNDGSGGGGAYARLSLDPRCYFAVIQELKTDGMLQMWQFIRDLLASSTTASSSSLLILLLQLCEGWAKYVSLPLEFVDSSVSLVLTAWQQQDQQVSNTTTTTIKAGMAYWISIMESGTWTEEDVLASFLVRSKEQQSTKKKQTSRSKKRTKQKLENKTTNELVQSAQQEVQQRGQAACIMAHKTWPVFEQLLLFELQQIANSHAVNTGPSPTHSNVNNTGMHGGSFDECDNDDDDDDDVQGDGPIGGIAACANACLPHILRESVYTTTTQQQKQQHDSLLVPITQSIQHVCASRSRVVRGFAAESLYTLHSSLVGLLSNSNSSNNTMVHVHHHIFEAMVSHFHQSCMNLASRCGYPVYYFKGKNLDVENNERLESERNDVREVLRTISGVPSASPASASSSSLLTEISLSILLRIIQGCAQPIYDAGKSQAWLFPETALHAFSALAKSINSVAVLFATTTTTNEVGVNKNIIGKCHQILDLVLDIASTAGNCLLSAFSTNASINDVLPLSRLYNLAIASLSPMLSKLCQIPNNSSMDVKVRAVIKIGIEASVTSLITIPELTGPSTLRQTRFDIRGAMRSPGGEDHVGVLTLVRLAFESECLSKVFLQCKETILIDLCKLYEELKKMEEQRGVGIIYGIGVFPKSRRILLGVICHLEIVSGGTMGASDILGTMLKSSMDTIAGIHKRMNCYQAEDLYRVCESTFDIASFSSDAVQSVFNISDNTSTSLQAICLHVLHGVGNFGYVSFQNSSTSAMMSNEIIVQWNRTRAALFTLFRVSGRPDIPASIIEILISLITTECEAVLTQCSAGPESSSRFFHEDIISEEETGIPPGMYIRAISETLEKELLKRTPISSMRNCLHVLYSSRQSVLRTLTSECPMPHKKGSFHDPRPVIGEVWFSCMQLIAVAISEGGMNDCEDMTAAIKQLLVDTFVVAISLLLYSSLEKTHEKRANDPGMGLDGPQGLTMIGYIAKYFNLGPVMIQLATRDLLGAIPVVTSHGPDIDGISIIGAALFRGFQGGLPPWAVESAPSIYSSLFNALNRNVDTYGIMFEMSMHIKLRDDQRFGSVDRGSFLTGRFLERLNDKARRNLIDQAKELAGTDTTVSWRRLKTLIKQSCGGKKKDTDFKQRPALTNWDALDRK